MLLIPLLVPIIVHNPDFFHGFKFLLIISVGFAFRGVQNMYNTPILYLRKTRLLTQINLYTSIFQVILSIVFVKYLGLEGIFLARFIIKPLQTLIFHVITKGVFEFHINFKKQLLVPIVYTLVALALYKFYFIYNITLLNILQLLIVWGLTFLIYKTEIVNLAKGYLKVKR